jgi:hypothetical protein
MRASRVKGSFFVSIGASGADLKHTDPVGLRSLQCWPGLFPPEPPVAIGTVIRTAHSPQGRAARRAEFTLAGEHGSDTKLPRTGGSGGNNPDSRW